jgi:gliding motility-associated-like protein
MHRALRFILTILFISSSFLVFAQPCSTSGSGSNIPTKCFEIESILVDACDTCGNSCEGVFEMIRLRVGASPLSVSSIGVGSYVTGNVAWGTGSTTPFRGFCDITSVPANQAKINTINNSIIASGKCGRLIPINSTGTIPAGANVLIFMSTLFSPLTHSFANLTDTLYVLMQCAGNVSGHFSNSASTTRRLIMNYGSSCGDTVTYLPTSLVDQSGNTPTADGATVNFTYAGSASYVNYGCAIPVMPLTVDAGTTGTNYCSGNTVPLYGTVVGTSCFSWYPKVRTTGTFSDTASLTTSFTIASNYSGSITLYLKANVACGSVLDSVTFLVNPSTASVSITALTDTVICNRNILNLNATGTTLPVSWTTAGKGSFNATNNLTPIYTPNVADTNYVWFVVAKTTSCGVAKDSVRVRFTPSPNPNFTPSDTVVCINSGTVNLNPVQNLGVFIGTNVTGNVFNVPNAPGLFSIKRVVTLNGCSDSVTKYIRVAATTNSAFSISDTIICLGKSVTINPVQSGGVYKGALIVSNVFTPITAGLYTITYVITNGKCADSTTRTIRVNNSPNPNFVLSDTIICKGTATISITPNTSGGVFVGQNLSGSIFTPSTVGDFAIKYKITQNGCSDSATKNIHVLAQPDASFTISDTLLCLGTKSITLKPLNTGGVFKGITLIGNTFTPTAAGFYQVTYIINNGICKDSLTKTIHIVSKSNAGFIASDTMLCQGDPAVTFTTSNAGGTLFGSLINNGMFYPDSAGTFVIKYLVGAVGCLDSSFKTIHVFPKPKAIFSYTPQNPVTNEILHFTYTGTKVNYYLWQFGDDQTSTIQNPTHTYTTEKKYPVWLTVKNSDGCVDSTLIEIDIAQEERIFVPNVFTPNGDSINDYFVVSRTGYHDYHIYIYNRWGGLIYESMDPISNWDGSYNGSICSDGVYVFLITALNHKGSEKTLRGTITLLK